MPAFSARRDGRLVRKSQDSRPQPLAKDVGQQDRKHQQPDQGGAQPQTVQGQVGQPVPQLPGHVYVSRYRPRSQVLTRFRSSVLMKSSMPTAKIVR